MKTYCLALALAALPGVLLAQDAPAGFATRNQLTVGPTLGNRKVKDLQASPLMYVANPAGLQLTYAHISERSRFRAEVQAGTSSFTAPALGPRTYIFTDEKITGETTRSTLVLAPDLYQGSVQISYLRRVNTANPANKWRSFAGLSLHDQVSYADGVAMTTWALNSATLNLALAGEWHLRPAHVLTLQGAVPLVGLVSRLPYSNVLSYPERSYAHLFFSQGTRLATWNRLQRLQLQVGYEAQLSPHFGLGLQYQVEWFHYSRPRSITSLSNQGNLQVIYHF
ncbi:hypothetical protein [Hymenobacter cellulosivorans]|uniref:DUF481 domain-containing protein n=1 Tax=Hymenobacter cellulosivorans TaxID=2932249 RepID=A0ABY4F7Q5_9BACT|nr:hypothetical protein [Hymenobacter cellulosivorans]UOQ52037.1 hypothetical protein MUN80_20015 [Hymenobacter cellulosivorans]